MITTTAFVSVGICTPLVLCTNGALVAEGDIVLVV